jgi:hypothetical protein
MKHGLRAKAIYCQAFFAGKDAHAFVVTHLIDELLQQFGVRGLGIAYLNHRCLLKSSLNLSVDNLRLGWYEIKGQIRSFVEDQFAESNPVWRGPDIT